MNDVVSAELVSIDSDTIADQQRALDVLGAKGEAYVSTIPAKTFADKLAIATAMTSAENLSDNLGHVFHLVGFTAQPVTVVDSETGEEIRSVRVVLVSKDGEYFASVAGGVQSAIGNLLMIFGDPSEWVKNPIPVKAVQGRTRVGRQLISLIVSPEGK